MNIVDALTDLNQSRIIELTHFHLYPVLRHCVLSEPWKGALML